VVVIEHDMALIASTCDRVVVLDFGHKIADGTPDQIQNDTTVVKAYLGEPTTPVPAMVGPAPQTETETETETRS
jgi:ABC-type hemin transport system ATPase subunit